LTQFFGIGVLPRACCLTCLGRKYSKSPTFYFKTMFRTKDKEHTLLFYRNLNSLLRHSNREIMFDASKPKKCVSTLKLNKKPSSIKVNVSRLAISYPV